MHIHGTLCVVNAFLYQVGLKRRFMQHLTETLDLL